ncbi:hypothetical protein F8M41_019409 [Gigaspora margarita]|uniref:Uncharacterized protein n=1 Tax=Gigaspora margarita TaxID=4874 RepID=A0A8H4EUC5_GIGMA|nr:hypothetical protein F8M41_019409 [Gigaspora margarita]
MKWSRSKNVLAMLRTINLVYRLLQWPTILLWTLFGCLSFKIGFAFNFNVSSNMIRHQDQEKHAQLAHTKSKRRTLEKINCEFIRPQNTSTVLKGPVFMGAEGQIALEGNTRFQDFFI